MVKQGKFEFNFYNCKKRKNVLCEVPTDMEWEMERRRKTEKMKRPSGFIRFNDTMLDDGSIRV